jgi:hypothetical protein
MKLLNLCSVYLLGFSAGANASLIKRAAEFLQGQPIDGKGKGARILGKWSRGVFGPQGTDKL